MIWKAGMKSVSKPNGLTGQVNMHSTYTASGAFDTEKATPASS